MNQARDIGSRPEVVITRDCVDGEKYLGERLPFQAKLPILVMPRDGSITSKMKLSCCRGNPLNLVSRNRMANYTDGTNHIFRPADILCPLLASVTSGMIKYSHSNHVCGTSLMSLLIFCAPGFNGVAKVSALVFDLRVVTHGVSSYGNECV